MGDMWPAVPPASYAERVVQNSPMPVTVITAEV